MVVMASCCMCFESHHVACLMQCRYLDVCKYNREIFDTEAVQESEAERQQALRNVVIFLILSPFDNEQSDLLARVSEVRVSWPHKKGPLLLALSPLHCGIGTRLHTRTSVFHRTPFLATTQRRTPPSHHALGGFWYNN
jgi:hypothetical protein